VIGFQPTYEELKPVFVERQEKERKGFQPTYEELKQPPCVFSVVVFRCFQPTYEELKPTVHEFFLEAILGFQPTYEELKLRPFAIPADWKRVSSLPMRNWNHVSSSAAGQQVKFPAYLWGIETLTLPFFVPLFFSFQPTYEELKPNIVYLTQRLSFPVSSLPMRNWNPSK